MKMTTSDQHQLYQTRRYDIDWLRILAFILLIFYHIGLYYVAEWGWHVKSQYQSEFLQYFMLLVNQWRMPLIFFISGLVLSIVEPKMSTLQLFKLRFLRIFVPLVIGIYLIIPPQVFYEAVSNLGYGDSYWNFWQQYTQPNTNILPEMHHSELGLFTWNHLWYLLYLWVYTLVYLVIRPIILLVANRLKSYTLSTLMMFCVPIVVLTIFGLWLKPLYPKTYALIDDWYHHGIFFSVFLFGYFVAKLDKAWQAIVAHRRFSISIAFCSYSTLMIITKTDWISLNGYLWNAFIQVWVYTNMWSWLLAAVGYAGAYLNKPNSILTYLNEAILPWYILHQTAIIIIAVKLSPLALGGFYEPALLVVGTFATCALLYSFIRRWNILRFIFGMKLKRSI